MADKKVAGLLATDIGLNTDGVVESLSKLKSAVKDSTNEWKQMESQAKQSGDTIGASKARFEGLNDTVSKQEQVLAKLKQEQSEVNRSTEAGEQTYQKYATQITQAERQLGTLITQQGRAKQAYELQESGIASLNKEIKQSIEETNTYVERLKAEGKEDEALEAKKQGLSKTLEKQTALYEAQVNQLNKLKQSGDYSEGSLSKQKITLDKTATSIANAKKELSDLGDKQTSLGKNEGATESGKKFAGLKSKIADSKGELVALGATATAVVGSVGVVVDKIYDQQNQVNELQAKTTLSYKQSKEGISAINGLYAKGYGESIEDLEEIYGKLAQLNPNASVKELAENTKLVSTYSKQSGVDSEEVMAGADRATKAWNISYSDYFDNMTTLQKMGLDTAGDVSDNMAEYSQVMGQMGLSMNDTMNLIKNGVDSGAYNADKLLDFTKEFQISLNDGRMDESISAFSKKSQEMFKGYKDGSVTAGDMFKQITSEMGTMTDKQKEATLASNLWSALGEDNSLQVLGSLGKTSDAFDNVKGSAKKTSDQLKESNPFELIKRSAESSINGIKLNDKQTKEFNKSIEPLAKSLKKMIESFVKEMPKISKELTPIFEFTAKNLDLIIKSLGVLAGIWGGKKIASILGLDALPKLTKRLFVKPIKPKVDAGSAKTELTALGKLASDAGKKMKSGLSATAKVITTGASKSLGLLKKAGSATGRGLGKALSATAKVVTTGATKSFTVLKKAGSLAGKGIAKSLSVTAKVATAGAVKGFALLKKGASGVASGFVALTGKIKAFSLAQATATIKSKAMTLAMKAQTLAQKAMNLAMKANPFGIALIAITALIAGFVALYKHSKKFRDFVNGIAKAVKDFGKNITKGFSDTWKSVTKGLDGFGKGFSKGWSSFTSGASKTWDNFGNATKKAWSATTDQLGKSSSKYYDTEKKGVKVFTDFFTGKWGNLGKDLKDVWNSLWDFLESIFGKKIGSIKKGIEDFAGKIGDIFNDIKKKVSDTWQGLWDGMKNIVKDGLNVVIDIINAGIGGIDSIIHTFGGKENAIGKIDKIKKFENGTKGAPKGLAMVNDAPGANYQEAIIDNSGEAHVLEGRNRLVNFSGGETVIPAHAMPKFAKGTDDWLGAVGDWFKDKWEGLTEFIKHPLDSLGKVMNKAINGMIGNQNELVTKFTPAMGNGLVGGIVDPIKKMFESLKKKHDDDGGGSKGAPSGSGVNRWRDQVVEALKANGLSTSEDMVNKVLRQIATESGGNEKAVQGGYTDINTITGDLAKGLMQTISATFNAYKFPGHGDIFNGYDNLLAALKYAKNRYGSDLSFLGQGHGYEYGGLVSQHGFYEVAEKNMPEMIIPLSADKKNRANQLLSEANYHVNGNDQSTNSSSNTDISGLQAGINQLIGLVGMVLGVNKDQLTALSKGNGVSMPDLYNRMAMDSSMKGFQSI